MPQPEHDQKVIALIEDEKIISQLLVRKLEAAGYAVKTADDGIKGIKLVKELNPDLILLDMMLPRIDGFGVLEALRNEKSIPRIPLIIISNSGQPIEVERALELGARDYFIKVNFDPQDVVAKVRQFFNPAQAKSPPGTAAHARILLVEDDLMLVQLLERKLLQQQKYDVHKAFDVPQARTILAQYGADIILLDIVLPGIDGFTFLNELKAKQEWKDIPVIIMSNLGQQEEIKRGTESGAIDYVVKAHTNPQEIIEKIDAVINK
ncbi:MAG: response regulator [Candidatus Sungbacteria bacterium]|nr:response regulator [Candidatus Sungbacteria bacterium]